MKDTILLHKRFFGACSAVALMACLALSMMMLKPPVSKAAVVDMQAFVFPPVTVNAGQSLLLCGSDMGEIQLSGTMGLLDVTDTTKSLARVPFSLKPNTGLCTTLPAVQRNGEADGIRGANVIAYVEFPASTTWNSTSGKAFVASLQLREGNSTRFALAPTFMPAVPIPQP